MEKYAVNPYAETYIAGAASPLSFNFLRNVPKAVCAVLISGDPSSSHQTGFLAKFPSRSGVVVHGLFTTHRALGRRPSDLADGSEITLQFAGEGATDSCTTIKLCTAGLFRFTCSLLGATFVQFNQAAIQKFKECFYLQLVPAENEIDETESVIVLEYPRGGGEEVHFTQGYFSEYFGLDILHSVSIDDHDSSGAPLILHDGSVVGVYKGNGKTVAMVGILKALFPFLDHNPALYMRVISNPLVLDTQYNSKVLAQGLERFPSESNLMYVSPASTFEGGMITPIWFVATSHGWFWTPTDPLKPGEEANWMAVSQLEVVGGFWHDEIPAERNVKIIQWLSANNINCGICPQ